MEGIKAWLVPLLVLVGFGVLAVLLRRARMAELQRHDLTKDEHDGVRIRLLEHVRRHSYQFGTWVELAPFWKAERVKSDADRFAILWPLLDEVVLLIPARADGIDALVHRVVDWFALELPSRVQLPEMVFWRMYQGEPLVIQQMTIKGDWVMGDQDKSVNTGIRAGGDIAGGDQIGRDKAGRDAHGVSAGGSIHNSANVGSAFDGNFNVSTIYELGAALTALAEEAQRRGEPPAVVDALRWAAQCATGSQQPNPLDQATHQRTLDRASEWLQVALQSVAEGATGALVGHWLLNILHA